MRPYQRENDGLKIQIRESQAELYLDARVNSMKKQHASGNERQFSIRDKGMFDSKRLRQGSKVSRTSLRSAWDWRNQKNNEVMDRMASMMYSVHINDHD